MKDVAICQKCYLKKLHIIFALTIAHTDDLKIWYIFKSGGLKG